MSAQHTPTPWATEQRDIGWLVFAGLVPGNRRVPCMTTADGTPEERAANAAFVVRAVNAHEALVAALNGSLYALEMLAGRCTDRQSEVERLGPVCQCKAHQALRATRAALAAAGETP